MAQSPLWQPHCISFSIGWLSSCHILLYPTFIVFFTRGRGVDLRVLCKETNSWVCVCVCVCDNIPFKIQVFQDTHAHTHTHTHTHCVIWAGHDYSNDPSVFFFFQAVHQELFIFSFLMDCLILKMTAAMITSNLGLQSPSPPKWTLLLVLGSDLLGVLCVSGQRRLILRGPRHCYCLCATHKYAVYKHDQTGV